MDRQREYEIRLWGADKELLYVVPTISMTEKEAHAKATELLSVHDASHFTIEPQISR